MKQDETIKVLLEVDIDVKDYLRLEATNNSYDNLAVDVGRWARSNLPEWIKNAQTKEILTKKDWEIVWKKLDSF